MCTRRSWARLVFFSIRVVLRASSKCYFQCNSFLFLVDCLSIYGWSHVRVFRIYNIKHRVLYFYACVNYLVLPLIDNINQLLWII